MHQSHYRVRFDGVAHSASGMKRGKGGREVGGGGGDGGSGDERAYIVTET